MHSAELGSFPDLTGGASGIQLAEAMDSRSKRADLMAQARHLGLQSYSTRYAIFRVLFCLANLEWGKPEFVHVKRGAYVPH